LSRLLRLFFFSSRRRHTRFSRDWSSDVCSSDLARLKGDNCLLPVVTLAQTASGALALAQNILGSNALNLHVEQAFDGLLDFQLGRIGSDFENELTLLVSQNRGLLGDVRAKQHFECAFLVHPSSSSNFFTAETVTSTFSYAIRLTGSEPWTSRTSTCGRLRAARYRF